MSSFAQTHIVNIETNEELIIKDTDDLKRFFPKIHNARSQLSNLRSKTSNTARIGSCWFSLKGVVVEREKYQIRDIITGDLFESYFIETLAKKIESDRASTLRLLKRDIKKPHYNQLNGRYVNLMDSKTFILVEKESGKEFECAVPKSIFLHLGKKFNENLAKAVSAVARGVHKTVNIDGRFFYLKGEPAKFKDNSEESTQRRAKQKLSRRIRSSISAGIRTRIKGKFEKCGLKTEKILGCSIPFLKDWIEKQFQDGMSWQNMGSEKFNKCKSWHIDHIVPCSRFDFSKESEVLICFHYTNLRPLWEEDNLRRPKNGSDLDLEILIAAKRC